MTNVIDNITCVIKTFERPACCQRLIESIRKYYPGMKIVVADDSRASTPIAIEGVTWIGLPFDVGISAGRNAALARVQTKWFVLLDDDMVFTERTNIGLMLEVAITFGLDILGGKIEGQASGCGLMYRASNLLIFKSLDVDEMVIGTDRVNNFFLGWTEAVRKVGWDEKLKLAEHTAFFWRAKGRLKIGWTAGSTIKHEQQGNEFYNKHRDRALDYFKIFMKDEILTRCIIDGVTYCADL